MAGRNTARTRPAAGSDEAIAKESQCTPEPILHLVYDFFGAYPDLDPASNPQSIVQATVHVWLPHWAEGRDENDLLRVGILVGDGLKVPWRKAAQGRPANVYNNPPYGRSHNGQWARKNALEGCLADDDAAEILALVPSAPSAKWWLPYRPASHGGKSAGACLMNGRLQFRGALHKADFDTSLIYFGRYPERFRAKTAALGWVIT